MDDTKDALVNKTSSARPSLLTAISNNSDICLVIAGSSFSGSFTISIFLGFGFRDTSPHPIVANEEMNNM
jgi:hypothetical protein